jgi:hypothetical protein
MPNACCPDVKDDVTTQGRGRGTDELRTAYFAHAGEFAIRYGVVFDRLIEQVRGAEACAPHTSCLAIRYVDDLIHAVACVDGVDLAWMDLSEQHERVLARTCRERLEPTDAIVFVRRFFAWLRETRRGAGRPGAQTMRAFDGSASMRRWLRERLLDALDRGDPWADAGPGDRDAWAPFPAAASLRYRSCDSLVAASAKAAPAASWARMAARTGSGTD